MLFTCVTCTVRRFKNFRFKALQSLKLMDVLICDVRKMSERPFFVSETNVLTTNEFVTFTCSSA